MSIFTLPDLGEGLQEAEIVTWHVSVGDHLIADQPLVSVETDKAVVEVPAPFSGTVARLFAQVGDIVGVGARLVDIDSGKAADKGAIVGDIAPAAPPIAARPKSPAAGHAAPRASPAVRRLARQKGVDLTGLTGSGPDGAILSGDIPEAPSGPVAGTELRGVRRAMAGAMTRSHACVVPATVTDRADIHRWPEGETAMVRLVNAIAVACASEPALNAWFDGRRLQRHDHVDLAIAVDTQEGLFAPVLRGIETARDIGARVKALRHAVDTRSIAPDMLKGATITLSNFGMIGGEFAALVVTPPQVAILGAGRISQACLVSDGDVVIRRVLPLSLTFDHRAVTGGEAARFMAAVRGDLERATIAGKG
jgi:2-oxoisovalerate dehydrogenase E2 component (dihydrolipoyl transacylase)